MPKVKHDIETIRHSTAHVLAAAVMKLFPEAKLGVGPIVEHGFYYDFQLPRPLTDEDLPKIKKEMLRIIKSGTEFTREEMSIDDAIVYFKKQKQDFKVELLEDLKKKGTTSLKEEDLADIDLSNEKVASVYHTGEFTDLCRGPHVANTKELSVFKLTKLAGAYWRGDENNPQLQRVYGVAFTTKEELVAHLTMLEEAKKRDHRKLGKELDLFVFSSLVGSGLPLYTPRGNTICQEIKNYTRELQEGIYSEVATQPVSRAELFKISGHYDKFKDDMLRVHSNYSKEEYFLKPMNCPQHIQIFASHIRSYKDLPIRYADFTHLHRDEKPGELQGLTRLRGFCQDDGHSFCREDQVAEEFELVLRMIQKAMETYSMNYSIRLSLWDPQQKEKYLGEAAVWEKAQKLLEDLLKKNNITYTRAEGEAAFYGPKMDLVAHDSLGREWQISTIQLDLNLPKRFGITYVDKDGAEKTPLMIHRALVGSPERFMGILIEHYAGAFPAWLAPVQVAVLSVGEMHREFADALGVELSDAQIRVEVDNSDESVGYKIRRAEKMKIPYMLVVGDKEVKGKKLAVRKRGERETIGMTRKKFIEMVQEEIRGRK